MKQILMVAAIACTSILTLKAQKKDAARQLPLGVNEKRDIQFLKTTLTQKQTPSGLLYYVHFTGYGKKLPEFSKVKIRYNLATVDGKVVVPSKESTEIVDRLPYGIQEAVKMMPVGSEWSIGLPLKLCSNKYGKIGGGKVLMGKLVLIATIK